MPPPRATPRAPADYIPEHLRHFVFHSQDDFYVSRHFDPRLLSHLMYAGFLPIASDVHDTVFLLPKLHKQRCVLLFQPQSPEHVPKSVRKKAKQYTFVLNRNFHAVVAGCHERHGIPWLYPPLVQSFETLFQAGETGGVELCPGTSVRLFTVELYDVRTDTLVAGELGYTVGSVYTSLTGFSRVSGAGTVQLHALSQFLYVAGFKMWDLGMSMDYKMGLGAKDVERDEFLKQLYKWRDRHVPMQLDTERTRDVRAGVSVQTLFEMARSRTETVDEKNRARELRGPVLREAVASGDQEERHGRNSREKVKGDDAVRVKCAMNGEKRKAASHDELRGEEKRGKAEADFRSIATADVDS